MRRQSEFRGEVSYDPKTLEARSVSLRSIVRGDRLVMGFDAGDFWAPGDIDELAAEREIRRVEDVDTLRDREASDEEVDRLLAALDEM